MTLEEGIMWFSGTAIGGTLIGAWISRKRNKFETYLAEQSFYKKLIADVKEDNQEKEDKIDLLTSKVGELSDLVEKQSVHIDQLLDLNKKKDKRISEQDMNLKKWEEYAEGLKKTVSGLLIELEIHENKK